MNYNFNFTEAFSIIRANQEVCMLSKSLLLALRYDKGKHYFLAAYPAKSAWVQHAVQPFEMIPDDWMIVPLPAGWDNSK